MWLETGLKIMLLALSLPSSVILFVEAIRAAHNGDTGTGALCMYAGCIAVLGCCFSGLMLAGAL